MKIELKCGAVVVYVGSITVQELSLSITRDHWTQCMTSAAETNAVHLQWQLGGRGTCSSHGVAGQAPAVAPQQTDRQTDRQTDKEHHNTFCACLSGGEGN